MRFKGASLRKSFFTMVTLVRLYTCMYSSVPLEIKRVIEPLSTERAQIPLGLAMAFKMAVQETLHGELLSADFTDETAFPTFIVLNICDVGRFGRDEGGVLYPVSTIDNFDFL